MWVQDEAYQVKRVVSKEGFVPIASFYQVAPSEAVTSVSPHLFVPLPASKLFDAFQRLKLEIPESRVQVV